MDGKQLLARGCHYSGWEKQGRPQGILKKTTPHSCLHSTFTTKLSSQSVRYSVSGYNTNTPSRI